MNKVSQIITAGLCLSLLALPAAADDAPVLKIENFIGTVDIVTGDYDAVEITDADGAAFEDSRRGITINDGQTVQHINCRQNKLSIDIGIGNWGWKKRSGGYKDLNEYPKVKITAPENTHLIVSDSVIFGEVGNIGSGDIRIRSCGDLEMANVSGELDLRISGSGDVSMGSAGSADISISGSGDLEAEDFTSLELSVSGSGDAQIGDIAGFADVSARGSGDIEIGNIDGGLEYRGSGSSNFDADYVSGDISVRSSGSGDVDIDDGEAGTLYVVSSGSSNIEYDGSSVDAEARASGSSDIIIRKPSGTLQTSDSGAGDVDVRG